MGFHWDKFEVYLFVQQKEAIEFLISVEANSFYGTDPKNPVVGAITGYRSYFGGDSKPSISPKKKNLNEIFEEQHKLEWLDFLADIRDVYNSSTRSIMRKYLQSVHENPICHDCMCEQIGGEWKDFAEEFARKRILQKKENVGNSFRQKNGIQNSSIGDPNLNIPLDLREMNLGQQQLTEETMEDGEEDEDEEDEVD